MAIVSIGPVPGYPKSTERLEGKRVSVSHTHRYQIITDNENDYGDALLNLLPDYTRVGWPFGFGNSLIRSRDLERDTTTRFKHTLTINADDKFDEETKTDKDKPPDQRKPEWSWDFETIERAMVKDVDGLALENSAHDIFEITQDIAIPVLTITRHQSQFDPSTIIDYVNHRNKTDFWTSTPGTVLCTGIRDHKDSQEVYAGISYRQVTYVFKFAVPLIADVLEGWKLLLVDNGPNEIIAGKKVGIKDDFGVAVRMNLDGAGVRQAIGAAPHIFKFEKFKEAEFNNLSLGPF